MAIDRIAHHYRLEVGQFALCTPNGDLMLFIAHRDAGGVISAIFEPLQASPSKWWIAPCFKRTRYKAN
jgi:hypothetical protein